jgi:hypothetical protein
MLQFHEMRLFASSASLLGVALLLGACEVGGPKPARFIAGPVVPSPIPTSPPYVWDTRTELEVWAKNAVTSGQMMTVQGTGPEAVINIDRPSESWVLRGPDLEPPAEAIVGVRIRYRWEPDSRLGPGASRTGSMTAHFEKVPFAIDQPQADAWPISPTDSWTEFDFVPASLRDGVNVRYVYLTSSGFNPGVLQIDRIALVSATR